MSSSFKDSPASDTQIREYFNILRDDPASRVFAPLAEALIRRGRLDEAEKICRMGIEANPEFSDGHLASARVQFYLFRHAEALEAVKLALALDPNNAEAYLIAAEIFLSRSQLNAASQACMKVLDLDPDNQQARNILKRTGAQVPGSKPREAVKMSTDSFRASAGTAPSRRLVTPGEQAPLAEPFRELLQATGEEGTSKLNGEEQPFSALSPGSHGSNLPADEEFDVPTRKESGWKRPPGTPAPQLPPHPQVPDDDLLSQVPGSTDASPEHPDDTVDERPAVRPRSRTPSSLPQPPAQHAPVLPASAPQPGLSDASLQLAPGTTRVDAVQAVIDRYSNSMPTEDQPPVSLKMPRSGRLLAVLTVLAAAAGIGALITLGLRSSAPHAATDGGNLQPGQPAAGSALHPQAFRQDAGHAVGVPAPAQADGHDGQPDAGTGSDPGDTAEAGPDGGADGEIDAGEDGTSAHEPDGGVQQNPADKPKPRARRRRRRRRPARRRRKSRTRRRTRKKKRRTRR